MNTNNFQKRHSHCKAYFNYPSLLNGILLVERHCKPRGNSGFCWSAAAAKSLQLCPTLCDLRDGSPLGSSVLGILQARTLEWVAISFSNA